MENNYLASVSTRDLFVAHALSNPAICTGTATEWQLRQWFGERMGIKREDVIARQALDCANALMAAL